MPRKTDALRKFDQSVTERDAITTYRELEAAGISRGTLSYRLRPGGPWQAVLPGVIALVTGQLTESQRLRSAVLYGGPDAVISGAAGLGLLGFRSAPHDQDIDLLIPHTQRRKSVQFVRITRTSRVPQALLREDLPTAPAARAVIDACRFLRSLNDARACIAEAVQRGYTTLPRLQEELKAGSSRHSNLSRRVLEEVTVGVRSVAEARARGHVAASDLPQPLWNVNLYDEFGEWIACPDGWWPEFGVALEIDSIEWHLSPADYKRTLRRQRRMTSKGIVVLAYAPAEIEQHPAGFIAQVHRTLVEAGKRPLPPITVGRAG